MSIFRMSSVFLPNIGTFLRLDRYRNILNNNYHIKWQVPIKNRLYKL